MLFKVIFVTVLAAVAAEQETGRRHRYRDPFAALDHHLSHSMKYLLPWRELFKAAQALDAEKSYAPKIIPDPNKYQIHLNVERFEPDELSVKVSQRKVIVHAKEKKFLARPYVKEYQLPPGSEPEEVTAELNEDGILTLSVPKHELPSPPPERIVPIIIKISEENPETKPVNEDDEEEDEDDASEEHKKITSTTLKAEITTEAVNNPVIVTSEAPVTVKKIEDKFPAQTAQANKIIDNEFKAPEVQNKRDEVTKGLEENELDSSLSETQ